MLELYGRSPVALSPSDDVTCRALIRPIARAVLSELNQPHGEKSADHPASSRVSVDIASGMLAAHHKISVDEARAPACLGIFPATPHHGTRRGRSARGALRVRSGVISPAPTPASGRGLGLSSVCATVVPGAVTLVGVLRSRGSSISLGRATFG